jgi:hypothetical protein
MVTRIAALRIHSCLFHPMTSVAVRPTADRE